MLKKRLVGVITVRAGLAVQSFGYSRYLPLGRPECLAENLDRWGVDEIVVLSIDRSIAESGPDFRLLESLGALGLSSPLVYGGGIRTPEDAARVIQLGADRVCVDSLLNRSPDAVRRIVTLVGSQAVIGVLPLAVAEAELHWRDYRSGQSVSLRDMDFSLFADRVVSEALLVDFPNEGRERGFDQRIVADFPLRNVQLIAFGGISGPEQIDALLRDERVSAVAVGNFLSYREHAVQRLKAAMDSLSVRPAEFATQ